MKKTNKEIIVEEIKKKSTIEDTRKLGCYSDIIEKLSKKELKKLTDNIFYPGDVEVSIRKKPYMVEISHVDNEIDFVMMTKEEYVGRYGDEEWDD